MLILAGGLGLTTTKKKPCTRCKRKLGPEHFSPTTSRGKVYASSACKKCLSEVTTASRIRRRKLLRIRLVDYLNEHPCVDCGEADILVLEFDHRDASTKDNTIANMMVYAHSWERIEREIKLCDVRCANCHRRKTHKQLGWHGLE